MSSPSRLTRAFALFVAVSLIAVSFLSSSCANDNVRASSTGSQETVTDPNEQGEVPPKEYGNQFLKRTIRYTGGEYENEEFRYQLLPPNPAVPGKRYPLIVWLHGHGVVESAENDLGRLNWTGLLQMTRNPEEQPDQFYKEKKRGFFMFVPHCPLGDQWFYKSKIRSQVNNQAQEHDILAVVESMLDEILSVHPVDPNRVSIASVSAGGTAAWELAMRNPDRFSAVAPMGSYGGDLSRAHLLVDVPIWTFHNQHDPKAPIHQAEATIDRIRSLGGSARLTAFDSAGHNCWSRAFREYNLTNWLISQRRGQSRLTSRFSYFFAGSDWWKPVAFWGGLVAAWVLIKKSMRKRKENLSQV